MQMPRKSRVNDLNTRVNQNHKYSPLCASENDVMEKLKPRTTGVMIFCREDLKC